MLTGAAARTVTAAVAALAALALGGCAGGDDEPDSSGKTDAAAGATPSPSPGSPSTPAPPTTTVGVPEGVRLTAPGTQLAFGEAARVTYEAGRKGTVLGLRVDSAREGARSDFAGFQLEDPYQRRATFYYVRVTVRNLGKERFGGVEVPL